MLYCLGNKTKAMAIKTLLRGARTMQMEIKTNLMGTTIMWMATKMILKEIRILSTEAIIGQMVKETL